MLSLASSIWLALLVACSGGEPADDTVNICRNCLFNQCCINGMCVDGTLPQQCGANGNPCGICTGGPCVHGACAQQNCNAITCSSGCCSVNGCVVPPSTSACGVNGETCQACAPNEICDRGRCQGSIATRYEVILASALISKENCPDLIGECDLIVAVSIGSRDEVFSSENAPADLWQNTNHPVWNYPLFTASTWELTHHPLKIMVRDDNVWLKDFVADCQMSISSEDLIAGSVSGRCGTVELLSFTLRPAA